MPEADIFRQSDKDKQEMGDLLNHFTGEAGSK